MRKYRARENAAYMSTVAWLAACMAVGTMGVVDAANVETRFGSACKISVDTAVPSVTVTDGVLNYARYDYMTLEEEDELGNMVEHVDLQTAFSPGLVPAAVIVQDAHGIDQTVYVTSLQSLAPLSNPAYSQLALDFRYSINKNRTFDIPRYGFIESARSIQNSVRAELGISRWFPPVSGSRYHRLKLRIHVTLSGDMQVRYDDNAMAASVEEKRKLVDEEMLTATAPMLFPNAYIFNISRFPRYIQSRKTNAETVVDSNFLFAPEPTVMRDNAIASFVNISSSARPLNYMSEFDVVVYLPYAQTRLFYSTMFACVDDFRADDFSRGVPVLIFGAVAVGVSVLVFCMACTFFRTQKEILRRWKKAQVEGGSAAA